MELLEKITPVITTAIEAVGIAVIVGGLFWALIAYAQSYLRKEVDGWECVRTKVGRSILLGLELLVAADIVDTVAVKPNMDNVLLLGVIVLIRTFLSFSLEIELEGTLPWRKKERMREENRTPPPKFPAHPPVENHH